MLGEADAGKILAMVDLVWLTDADAPEWPLFAGLLAEFWSEVIPGERPIPVSELQAELLFAPRHRRVLPLLGRWDDRPVAAATLVMDDRRPDTAWLKFLFVTPERRRQGIGGTLLDALAARAVTHGRTRLSTSTPLDHLPATAFMTQAEGRPRDVSEQSRCPTRGLDVGMLTGWVDRAHERASGYSLVSFDGVCPAEHLEAFAAVVPVMNTAPGGHGNEQARPSPEYVRDNMEAHVRQGNDSWTVCARDNTTGDFVGYTELSISHHRRWWARQGDTGVDPDHRRRGIGRWLKAHNALRLLGQRPDVEYIETWNAVGNTSMLAINRAMAFEPIRLWRQWDLPVCARKNP